MTTKPHLATVKLLAELVGGVVVACVVLLVLLVLAASFG